MTQPGPRLKEQWWRVQRFRERYADALESVPDFMMSMEKMSTGERGDMRRWGEDVQDFGISCCQHLHHLKDWAHNDPTTALDKTKIDKAINASDALGAMADICNGTKHAILTTPPRSDVVEPEGVVRKTALHAERDETGAMKTSAAHLVETSTGKKTPLLDLIDESIAQWYDLLGITPPPPPS